MRAGAADAGQAALRLPGMLAWEARVEAGGEWPFDSSTWLRFAVYLVILLLSWLGGVAVERGLDALLE